MSPEKEGAGASSHADPQQDAHAVAAPHDPLSREDGTAQVPDPVMRAYRAAIAVKDSDPALWRGFIRVCRAKAMGGGRITAADVVKHFRWRVAPDGTDYAVNNNHIPVFMREACREWPTLREHMELRKSRFDALYPDVCGRR